MHLMVPFAACVSASAGHVLSTLRLPQLDRLISRLQPTRTDAGDEYTLTPPHENALATLWGWRAADGGFPFGAHAATQDGLMHAVKAGGHLGWGLLSPVHWHVGTDQVNLTDPADLALDEATSRELFAAVRSLFLDDGWALHWGAATRWYATHESLATLPCASLDRVIGRNIDRWLTSDPQARRVRRLQSEVQMLLHNHPVNDEREACGLLPVNSFWLSGCGLPEAAQPTPGLVIDARLRAPAMAEDWAAWSEAWQALDEGPVGGLLRAAVAGEPATLTLCGERSAQVFEAQPGAWWRRGPLAPRRSARAVLEAL